MGLVSIFIWQCSEVANTEACKVLIVRSNRTAASKNFNFLEIRDFDFYKKICYNIYVR